MGAERMNSKGKNMSRIFTAVLVAGVLSISGAAFAASPKMMDDGMKKQAMMDDGMKKPAMMDDKMKKPAMMDDKMKKPAMMDDKMKKDTMKKMN